MPAATLSVYIASHCPTSRYSRELAKEMADAFPELEVEVIDVDAPAALPPGGAEVLFTPGYFLNGRLVAYGNPRREELERAVRQTLAGGG